MLHQDLTATSLDAYADLANSQSSVYQREGQGTVSAMLPGEPEVVKKINTTNVFTATSQICNSQLIWRKEGRNRTWVQNR